MIHFLLAEVFEVAAAVPATGLVHLVEILQRQMLVRARGRTVNNKQIYSTHVDFIEH